MADMIEAGSLDRRITLQRSTTTQNALGEEVETWVDVATVSAKRTNLPVRVAAAERVRGAEVAAVRYVSFRIRWAAKWADIDPTWRLIFEGRIFNIDDVNEVGRRIGWDIITTARSETPVSPPVPVSPPSPPVVTPPDTPPQTNVVNDAAELVAALASLPTGSTITLAADGVFTGSTTGTGGAFTGVRLGPITGSYTIQGQAGAYFEGLALVLSDGITFQDVDFVIPPDARGGSIFPVQVASCSNITFTGGSIRAQDGTTLANTPAGLFVRDSQGVTVSGVRFSNLHYAVGHLNCDDVTVENCWFYDLCDDAIRGGGVHGFTASGNRVERCHRDASDGDHPDCCQFWTVSTRGPSTDVLVTDNFYARGSDGGALQGFPFMQNQTSAPFAYHDGVTVTDNIMVGGLWNGLTLQGVKNGTATGNQLLADSRQVGGQTFTPWIAIDHCDTVTVTGNTTAYTAIQQDPWSPGTTVNLSQSGNTFGAVTVTDQGAAQLAEWLGRTTRLWADDLL